MIEIPTDLPAELVPLSWLIGVWEGVGVIDYEVDGERISAEFGHRVSFSHDGGPVLNYSSSAWLLGAAGTDESDTPIRRLASEVGYWALSRPHTAGDPGPGLLPPTAEAGFTTADQVEELRNAENSFDLRVTIAHSTGVNELYLGTIRGPRVDLATDIVVRGEGAKDHSASTRMYGLVDNHLLWAWDIAALGQDLRSHASGRLARV
jgi:hypothetical protein